MSRPHGTVSSMTMTPDYNELASWTARAPYVPEEWFARPSSLHGASHTQRVHIHAQRLIRELGWAEPDAALVLTAALWHDIGRTNDGVDPSHGAASAARALDLGLPGELSQDGADVVLFAIACHSLPDDFADREVRRWHEAGGRASPSNGDDGPGLAEPERALRVLWLLKDADALDRVRLAPWESADPEQLRHAEAIALIPFAGTLYAALG